MAPEHSFTNRLSTEPLKVPDHELLKLIGRGSYGEVWLARNVMGTYRAIKVVHRDAFDHDRPYEREYEGIRKFEPISRTHDSQVDVLHVGRDEGSFYYVMELADDSSLSAASADQIDVEHYSPKTLKSEMTRRGPLPVYECVEIGLALTTALAHLHKNQLVHRDVKPSNIIYLNGLPKLADIGLVCAFDATLSYVGTIGFVAPEGPGTPQADIYSLGKVLYETATARDRQDFPELPTQLSGTKEQQTALLELNEVLLKACDANPRDRYQSADEMQEDLLLLRSGKSLVRLRTAERRFQWARRMSIAALIAAVIGGGAYWNQARQTQVVRKLAQEKSTLAEEKTILLEENRQRLARLNVANGVQAMDQGDLALALLWFAEALPLMTNRPAAEALHRIRIQQTMNQHPRLLQVLPHEAGLISASLSPDGKSIATVSNNQLRIWDVASGSLKLGPLTQDEGVRNVAFTGDGRRLFLRSCGDQGNAHIFPKNGNAALLDADTGQPLFQMRGVGRSSLSPDGHWLAAARPDNVIELTDARTGTILRELKGHSDLIVSLTFDPDSNLLASGGNDKTVRVWRIPSGDALGSPIVHNDLIQRVIFSSDSSTLASASFSAGGYNGFIRSWHLPDFREVGAAAEVADRSPIFFDAVKGRRLLANSHQGVSILDRETHKPLLPPNTITTVIRSWDWSPDGLFLAIGNDAGNVGIWNIEDGKLTMPTLKHLGSVENVQFSLDCTRLVTAGDDGLVKVWDLTRTVDEHTPLRLNEGIYGPAPKDIYLSSALSGNGQHLVIGGRKIRVVNTETLTLEAETGPIEGTDDRYRVAIDWKGQQWAGADFIASKPGKPHNAMLWRRETEGVRAFTLKHPHQVAFLQFTKDGSQLITVAQDDVLRTWQTSDGALLSQRQIPLGNQRFQLSADMRIGVLWGNNGASLFSLDQNRTIQLATKGVPVNYAAFSPDGRRVATASSDQCAHIWDVSDGKELAIPCKHGESVEWVEWSSDGRQLLTAGVSPAIKIWDSNTSQIAENRPRFTVGSAHVAHFSPDGHLVAGRSDEGAARIWDISSGEPLTPELKHGGLIDAAMFVSANRLITLSDPGIIRVSDLKGSDLPIAFVNSYAQVISCEKLNSGVRRPITTAESHDRIVDLRGINAAFFTQSKAEALKFHRQYILPPFTLLELVSASYHLDKLRELDSDNPELPILSQMLDRYRVRNRERDFDLCMVDLSRYYNASLTMSWHMPDYGFDLAELGAGKQIFNGVAFDVRGLLQIASYDELLVRDKFVFPSGIYGVEVQRKAKRLHFLHATEGSVVPDGQQVGSYIIHYIGRPTVEIPLLYGRHLRDWFATVGESEEVSHGLVAWKGQNKISRSQGRSLHLFHLPWENPFPNLKIATVDFVAGALPVRPFLIALTVDPAD